MKRVSATLLLMLASACDGAPCPPAWTEPDGGYPGALVVSRSDEPDATPFTRCIGIDDGGCRDGYTGSVDSLTGRLNLHGTLVFHGWNHVLATETFEGGRASVCRVFNDEFDPTPRPPSECAIRGTVVFTRGGGGRFHAEFSGGRAIDGAFVAPPS